MRRLNLLSIAILAAGLCLASRPVLATAACTALGGISNAGTGECEIKASPNNQSGLHDLLGESLRICGSAGNTACAIGAGPGKITVPVVSGGNNLTIMTTGKVIMEVDSSISGNVTGTGTATGVGATITINAGSDILLAGNGTSGASITSTQAAGSCTTGGKGGVINVNSGGNVATQDGSVISVNGTPCPAGDIFITALPAGKIDIDGDVLSQSTLTGTGINQRPGGGQISIIAGCNLDISDTGVVSSRGLDPGADLVHLQACVVFIDGLVESTGHGHAMPTSPPNHCNLDPIAHPIGGGPSTFFAGCVEVWSGTTITVVDDNAGNNGEVNADVGGPGGTQGRGWIDLFARGDISITGLTSTFAVHSNGGLGQNTDDGGLITVKTSNGSVSTTGNAIQADAVSSGSKGGSVIVQANLAVAFGTANINARGASTGGGAQAGGHIMARSFNANVTGAMPGTLNAFGPGGTVDLRACLMDPALTYLGTVTGTKTTLPLMCTGNPDIPLGVPPGTCTQTCQSTPPPCLKSTVQSVLDPITGRFPGNAGPDLTFRLDLGQDELGHTSIQSMVTDAFDRNGDGYIILLVVKDGTGVLGGSTTQGVDISQNYSSTFALLGCSVTLNDPNKADGLPAGLIEFGAGSPGNIFVMDLHGANSEVAGWKVVGDGRYMRNVATSNSAVGLWFLGNGNTMHNGNGNNNTGTGILVQGNGNLIDSSDAFGNGGDGVNVVGASNTVMKVDAGDKGKGNNGDGVRATGNSNVISEVDAFANGGNGIWVSGSSNQLLKNNAGDKGKGNLLEGIHLTGASNLIQENSAYANVGNGMSAVGAGNTLNKNDSGDRADKANGGEGFLLGGGSTLTENKAVGNLGNGFRLTTSGFSLKKNVSGNSGSGYANGLCQYKFDVAGNLDLTGNKSNNVAIAGAGSPKTFAAGCK